MSSPTEPPSTEPLDQTTLLEHLPLPCIYLSAVNAIILSANAAAREFLVTSESQAQAVLGLSIFDTCFLRTQHISRQDLECLRCSAQAGPKRFSKRPSGDRRSSTHSRHPHEETRAAQVTSRFNANGEQGKHNQPNGGIAEHGRNAGQLEWTLSRVTIQENPYLVLTATNPQSRPRWEDVRLDTAERHAFFHKLVEPTFRNVPHITNVLHADTHQTDRNEASARVLDEIAPTYPHVDPEGVSWDMFNEDFTESLPLSESAGPTSLKQGAGSISLKRGFEHPTNGRRTLFDASTTVLNDPFSGNHLGVIVQSDEGQEWSNYLQRLDILSRATSHAHDEGRRPIMIRTMLLSGQMDFFSPSWVQFTGISSRALCSGSWADNVHPHDLEKIHRMTAAAMENKQGCECEIRFQTGQQDASYRYFSDRIEPLRDAAGTIVRWFYVSTDIHDMVLKRKEAHATATRLYNILDNMQVVIFTVDQNMIVGSAEGMMEVKDDEGKTYNSDSWIQGNLMELAAGMRPGGVPELTDPLKEILKGTQTQAVADYRVGDKYLRTIAVPDYSQDESLSAEPVVKGLVGLTMDLSAEHRIKVATTQLEAMKETDRLKSEFLANVSHELRTPIAGLLGMLDLLLETPLSELQVDYAHTLQSSARSLLSIVNDVLDLSKAEANAIIVEKIPFDYAELLDDVCKSNEVLAIKKGLVLEREPVHLPYQLLGDPGRIRQILQNLITNAIKFTATGNITVTSQFQIDDSAVTLETTIVDSGIGIDEGILGTLFRPFVQADQSTTRKYGGSGLGLSIARKMAQAMGGNVVLRSKKGEGTQASISLRLDAVNLGSLKPAIASPAMASHPKPKPKPDMSGAAASKADIHVLVVEDNKINQKVALAHLKKMGYSQTSCAENGAIAVEQVQAAIEAGVDIPDVVLMDCQMPVLDGYDATVQLRKRVGYKGPIIALTASAIQGDREKCLAVGMNDHIVKPASRAQLQEVIERCLR